MLHIRFYIPGLIFETGPYSACSVYFRWRVTHRVFIN